MSDSTHIDKLLDAIELIKLDQRLEAYELLRELIRENNNFEDAWLWMAVTVDSIDQSGICLDNVLRINPKNTQAAGALFKLREIEIMIEKRRGELRLYHDILTGTMWLLTIALFYIILLTYGA